MRPGPAPGLVLETMLAATSSILEIRLAELLMSDLARCDLGDGIEVVHDVEAVEIEMDCDVDDDAAIETAHAQADDTMPMIQFWWDRTEDLVNTNYFVRPDDRGTHPFVRHSAPYERIEIQLDANAFVRATIEDAQTRRARDSSH